jgi:hypothetical protein
MVLQMGQILKLIGIVATAGYLFGDQLSSAIHERYEYSFDGLRQGDIRFDFRQGRLVGLLNLRLLVKQMFGTNLTLTSVQLSFKQQGILLGVLNHTELVILPHAETVENPIALVIPAGPFWDRLEQIMQPGNLSSAIAPLEISGKLFLSNGIAIPISRSLNFLSIG